MSNEKINLVVEFRKMIAEIEAAHPGLEHTKTDDGKTVVLKFSKKEASGFDIKVSVGPDFVQIETDTGWHTDERDIPLDAFQNMVGLVRDILSPAMRIRELRAGGSPYRWCLEVFDGEKWINDGSTGLMFWNYFGKRTENIFQNNILPARKMDFSE